MSSSMATAVVMATIAVLVLLVVVTEGLMGHGRRKDEKWAVGKHYHSGMDDCGRNRTCRELSRECKTLLFTSMVDNYAGAGDEEIVTTVDKMSAMMEMFMEHKQNLTDCANETGIQLPNSRGSAVVEGGSPVKSAAGRPKSRVGWLSEPKYIPEHSRPQPQFRQQPQYVIAMPGEVSRGGRFGGGRFVGGRIGGNKSGGKWQHGNFGVSEEDAIELRKCLLSKKMMLNTDGSLNRDSLKAQISPAFSFQAGLQAAVEEAVDACPEPQDYNIHELNKCINKACVDNLQLDDEDDEPKETKWPYTLL